MAEERPEISLVVPVYNEEDVLPRFREKPVEVLRGLGRPFEIVFVDDGSTDRSPGILQELKAEIPEARVIRLEPNSGLSSALYAGFDHARGEILVSIDADLQNDPEDIPKLLERLGEYDMVCGWRKERDDPFIKRLSSKIGNGWRNWRMGESIHDSCSPLKAFKRAFLEHLPPIDGLHRWYPTLARMSGLTVLEVPVRHHRRKSGKSKYGVWNRLWKGLADLKAVKWMRRYRMRYEAQEV
jgi:glycosyltransferase involved in cell wall biosynthesis